ncbi:MAG: protein kinase domain-containing protein, partial [Rubripirellula sp.]
IHRDIKPANLIQMPAPEGSVGAESSVGVVKITDFGLAMFTEHDPEKLKLTTGDKIMGSPAFMSPEQFVGNAVDFRSDIYSLGATAWNLLFGTPPFAGGSVAALFQQKTRPLVIADDLPIDLPSNQWQLLMGMMDPNPDRRPDSYETLIDAIDRLDVSKEMQETIELPVTLQSTPLSMSEQPTIRRPVVGVPGSVSPEAVTQQIVPKTAVSADKGDADRAIAQTKTTSLEPVSGSGIEEEGIAADTSREGDASDTRFAARWQRWVAGVVVAVIGLLAVVSLVNWPSARGPRDYRRVVSSDPLYDGVTLAGWDVGGSMIGAWNAVQAPDASTAIACTTRQGALTRPLPELAHPRVSLFVWLQPDSGPVDIDFGFEAGRLPGRRGCLRLNADSVELGIKSKDFGDVSQAQRIETPVSMLDRYHVVYIEKQNADWYVFLEEELIGTIPIEEVFDRNAIRLVVHGSRTSQLGDPVVYFSDFQLGELGLEASD